MTETIRSHRVARKVDDRTFHLLLGADALAATAKTALLTMRPGETFIAALQRALLDPDHIRALLKQALVSSCPGIAPDVAAARIMARLGSRRVMAVFCELVRRAIDERERNEALLDLASMMPLGRPS